MRKKNSGYVVRAILICAAALFLFRGNLAFCQDNKSGFPQGASTSFQKGFKKCVNFLKDPDLYNRMIRYVQEERKAAAGFRPAPAESVILLVTDLALSLLCLWLTLCLITGQKIFPYKKYLWFLLILNFGWFVFLLIFRLAWAILYFMVIRLEPGLYGVILDNLTLAVTLTGVFVYIWLSARTFGLNFINSLKLFFISHMLYLTIIFALFFFAGFTHPDWSKSAGEKLGLKPMFKSYIADVSRIATKMNVLSLARFRAFRL